MGFLSYSKEKAMLAAGLAIIGMLCFWSFSASALQSLDSSPSPFTLVAFVLFGALCIPLVVGVAIINHLGNTAIVLNSTILALSTILTLAYIYVLTCMLAAVYHRLKK